MSEGYSRESLHTQLALTEKRLLVNLFGLQAPQSSHLTPVNRSANGRMQTADAERSPGVNFGWSEGSQSTDYISTRVSPSCDACPASVICPCNTSAETVACPKQPTRSFDFSLMYVLHSMLAALALKRQNACSSWTGWNPLDHVIRTACAALATEIYEATNQTLQFVFAWNLSFPVTNEHFDWFNRGVLINVFHHP